MNPHPSLAEKSGITSKSLKLWPPNFFKIIWELLKVVVRSTLTLTFLWQPSFDSDVLPNLLFCYKKIFVVYFYFDTLKFILGCEA